MVWLGEKWSQCEASVRVRSQCTPHWLWIAPISWLQSHFERLSMNCHQLAEDMKALRWNRWVAIASVQSNATLWHCETPTETFNQIDSVHWYQSVPNLTTEMSYITWNDYIWNYTMKQIPKWNAKNVLNSFSCKLKN